MMYFLEDTHFLVLEGNKWYKKDTQRCISTGTHRNGVPVQDKAAGTAFRLVSYATYFVCKFIYCVTMRVLSCF